MDQTMSRLAAAECPALPADDASAVDAYLPRLAALGVAERA
jgi:hypothetical protein